MLMFAFLVIALFCTQSSTDRSSRRVEPQLRWWFSEKCMILGGFNSPSVADIAFIPSIFIKILKFIFYESFVILAFTKFFFEQLRMIEIGPRVRWKRSSIFQASKKVSMKIEEIADVFLNSANFASHTFLTLAPPSGYALKLTALIKLLKVSWTSQLSYEILLRSSIERQLDKTNFISPKSTPQNNPGLLGLK